MPDTPALRLLTEHYPDLVAAMTGYGPPHATAAHDTEPGAYTLIASWRTGGTAVSVGTRSVTDEIGDAVWLPVPREPGADTWLAVVADLSGGGDPVTTLASGSLPGLRADLAARYPAA